MSTTVTGIGSATISGTEGDDSLSFGLGNDSYDGLGGNDLINYGASTAALAISLADGRASGADIGNDSFIGIEQALGGAGNDLLVGNTGGQTLTGGEGDDTFLGGAGGDSLDGGLGADLATYTTNTAGISVDLAQGRVFETTGTDTLVNVNAISGTSFADTMVGDFDRQTLLGSGGDDVLDGAGGPDSLDGGAGNDSVFGGEGDDSLRLAQGGGSDTLDGGVGNDLLDLSSATGDVTVDLGAGSAAGTGLTATVAGFEVALGGAGNDSLVGGAGDESLFGGAGNDSMAAVFGQGNDSFDGGDGVNTLDLRGGTFDSAVGADGYTIYNYTGPVGGGAFATAEQRIFARNFTAVLCFVAGTRIAVPGGELAVERLAVGDLVLSHRGLQPVVWMGRMSVDARRHPRPERVRPVLIRAGALGEGVPVRDLRVSPDHGMLVDGVLVPAKYLINRESILQEPWVQAVEYWHVELSEHAALWAEGAPAESYLDDGRRHEFEPGVRALFPDLSQERPEGFAPVVRAAGDWAARFAPAKRALG